MIDITKTFVKYRVHRQKSNKNGRQDMINLLSSISGTSRELISSAEIPSDWSRISRGKHVEIHWFFMCFYGTLSTWGKQDSELVSLRYPTNGPTKIKVVCLESCQDGGFRAFYNVYSAESKTDDSR